MQEGNLSEPPVPAFPLRPWSVWAGFIWGFAEATLFFIVPDVLLTFIALYSFRRSVKVLASILLGALAGGTLMFYAGQRSPDQAKAVVLRVPFVSPAMFEKTH
jgi:membrane protein YqaA with SNARE-associated domain